MLKPKAPSSKPAPDEDDGRQAVSPLFRRQVLEQLEEHVYGTILLVRPVSHTLWVLLFGAITVALLLFIAFFSTSRKAQCSGLLLPNLGVIRIQPAQSGIVVSRRVKEGDSVHAGDVLFVLSGERSSVDSVSVQKNISSLLESRRDSLKGDQNRIAMQSSIRIDALRHRTADLQSEGARIDSQIQLQLKRVGLSEQSMQRFGELEEKHFISSAQLQEKQAELLDQQQKLADLQRLKIASERDMASAQADMRDLELQQVKDEESIRRNISALDQDIAESETRREIAVRAPQDGTVSAITADVGQSVVPGAAVATLLPAGSVLEAEIYAPSRSVGFAQPGMRVLLRYQGYPYQKFGQYQGTVTEIANSPLKPDELPMSASAGREQEPLYRIRVKLDRQTVRVYGREMPLKSGMAVDAGIVLETRHLYEWILEPLYSVSGKS